MRYFCVPDIHGELEMAMGLLVQEGIINEQWERVDTETFTVQMGDFLNCVVESIGHDNRCLDYSHLFDILLVGNHEDPHFGGPAFNGFWRDPVLTHRLLSLKSKGRYTMALNCDDVVVSHAGIASDMFKEYFPNYTKKDPQSIVNEINHLWKIRPSEKLFTAIGWHRGGWGKEGGIMWADWKQYKTSKLKQLVGHSVGQDVRVQFSGKQMSIEPEDWIEMMETKATFKQYGDWEAICIDLGAGKHSTAIVGAWIENGDVRLVEYVSN